MEGTRISHIRTASATINVPHQTGTFIPINGPSLMRHYHPNSVVYIRIHFWYCVSHGFEQMGNDMCPLLWYHTEQFQDFIF